MQSLRDPARGGAQAFPTSLDPFTCTREELSEFAAAALALGVRYLGVCCGAAPHHIRAVAEAAQQNPASLRYAPDMSRHSFLGTAPGITRPTRTTRPGWKVTAHKASTGTARAVRSACSAAAATASVAAACTAGPQATAPRITIPNSVEEAPHRPRERTGHRAEVNRLALAHAGQGKVRVEGEPQRRLGRDDVQAVSCPAGQCGSRRSPRSPARPEASESMIVSASSMSPASSAPRASRTRDAAAWTAVTSPATARIRSRWWLPRSSRFPPPAHVGER